jgi:hypothetical protein
MRRALGALAVSSSGRLAMGNIELFREVIELIR